MKSKYIIALSLFLTLAVSVNNTQAEVIAQSTTNVRNEIKGEIKDLKGIYKEERRNVNATSSELFKRSRDQKQESMKKMQKGSFEIRKNALVKQLQMAVDNLSNIRTRISERITKAEAGGRVMTEAKASLVIADDKLAKAKIAVEALMKLDVSSTKTATTTAEVELTKPRQVGDAAIKAVKEARNAFKKVLSDIAHNMGLGEGKVKVNATSTTSN